MDLKNLDEIDNRILSLLQHNARLTYSEIGQYVGLSRVAAKNRVDALQGKGIIRGYHADIDTTSVPQTSTFILSIETVPSAYMDVAERCKAESIVKTLYATDGNNRLYAICVTTDAISMREFSRKLRLDCTGISFISYQPVTEIMKGTLLP